MRNTRSSRLDPRALQDPMERLMRQFAEHRPGGYEHTLHLARYSFAARYVKGRVSDVACGTGYGSQHLLQRYCTEVVGADVSLDAIRYAVAHERGPHFLLADGQRLAFKTGSFTGGVSLETIEHVPDPEAFVRELHRILEPGGYLVLSTPNYRGGKLRNPFHVREFRHEELEELLSKVFGSEVEWFGQLNVGPSRWDRRVVRAIIDAVLFLDRFNLLKKFLSYRFRASVGRYSLGISGEPGEILPWRPTAAIQIAVVHKRA
jgi:SAM-dependent methyltransferase